MKFIYFSGPVIKYSNEIVWLAEAVIDLYVNGEEK